MSKGYILALDQGTTSSRAIVFDEMLQQLAIAQQPLGIFTPKAGYVEQDANDIWQTQLSTAQAAINQAGLLATDITAIGITNQRETTIMWDKRTGKPVAPAIVWQDRRTHAWCEAQKQAGLADKVQGITGLIIDPYFSASKIVWLLDNVPYLRQQAEAGHIAFGTVDSWLLYNLSQVHVIETTNAARTMLMDMHTGEWSKTLLKAFDIPTSILPKILPSNALFGNTKSGLFSKSIPIVAVLGDQQAALYGQECTQVGMAKSTYGTGCFLLMNIGEQPAISQHHLLTTVAWNRYPPVTPPSLTYALEGSVFMAGAIVQWLRDNLGIIQHSQDIERLAKQVTSSEGVMLIPAFTGLGAPYWQANATASLMGMTRGTHKGHIARAALESIALQAYDVLMAMQNDSHTPLTELRVDGGAANNDLLMQFQADILNVPVLRPTLTESTAKGVAMLAAQSIGLGTQPNNNFGNSAMLSTWQLERRFEPNMSERDRNAHIDRWHYYIEQTLRQSQDKIRAKL